ncbi:acetylcholinesterase-1-like [Ornithodoros turicata]|uniref:acetylcholinesterase-1-like n=1 Tax=Ornithodoros turicata TaxID=34597 RepID=UPI00313A0ACE
MAIFTLTAVCSCFLLSVILAEDSDTAIIYSSSGVIRGFTQQAFGRVVDTYLGIPFAEPPVGDLRFKKPVPVRPWKGTLNATDTSPPCLQFQFDMTMDWAKSKKKPSEDCLYLNIWTPTCSDSDCNCTLKPIIINVFGGGYSIGASDWDVYDGLYMAARGDIIVANLNYRVGEFGFLNGKVPDAPGNQGLHDTLLAVKWIKENSMSFGGDPNRITLFGESAGAVTVGYFIVSPLARGLASRLIMQSGSPYWKIGDNTETGPEKVLNMARHVGCADAEMSFEQDHDCIMSCLRTVPGHVLLQSGQQLYGKKHSSTFFPSYGDEFLPVNPALQFEKGEFLSAQVLIGSNKDEGSAFLSMILPEVFPPHEIRITDQEEAGFYITIMFRYLMRRGNMAVRDHYFGNLKNANVSFALKTSSDAVGDYSFTCPANYFAQAVSSDQDSDVYYYYYTHRSSRTYRSEWMGVAHFEEFPFIMGLPLRPGYNYTQEEVEFSETMMDIWVTFAKTGKPPVVHGILWPRYSREKPLHVELNPKHFRVSNGVHEDNCRFWETYIKPKVAA